MWSMLIFLVEIKCGLRTNVTMLKFGNHLLPFLERCLVIPNAKSHGFKQGKSLSRKWACPSIITHLLYPGVRCRFQIMKPSMGFKKKIRSTFMHHWCYEDTYEVYSK